MAEYRISDFSIPCEFQRNVITSTGKYGETREWVNAFDDRCTLEESSGLVRSGLVRSIGEVGGVTMTDKMVIRYRDDVEENFRVVIDGRYFRIAKRPTTLRHGKKRYIEIFLDEEKSDI